MSQHFRAVSFAAAMLLAVAFLIAVAPPARGQVPIGTGTTIIGGSAGGVYIDPQGVVCYREPAAKDIEQARTRARNAGNVKDEKLAFVSLPKLFAQAKAAADGGGEIPQAVRYMQGLTQIRYVFAFPEEKDLIVAGPIEDIDATSKLLPVGKRTGRPILQLDDLVVSLRTAAQTGGQQPLGCTIDPAPDSLKKSGKVMADFANASRAERMEEMRKALGPQTVSVFGTAENTRLAFACIAADYKLKRICLGLDTLPVPGVGSGIDNSRSAANRHWFELDYEPLLVSADGNSFELRGQRLQVKAGAQSFDPRGATDAAKTFAKQFTAKLPQIATNVPLFADLQNIADLSVLSTLIQHDKLDARVAWDMSWIMNAKGYAVASVPISHSAETLVNFTNGSICAGGITFTPAPLMDKTRRQTDEKNELAPIRAQAMNK